VTDDILIGIEWVINRELASAPMDQAPFATMPVTRRAPYACLAAWTGGHDNPFWTKYDPSLVHFLDADLSKLRLDAHKYRALTKTSKETTESLLHELAGRCSGLPTCRLRAPIVHRRSGSKVAERT
jgi:hypothetical protein